MALAKLIAFTGTHGTGKTTAVYNMAAMLKKEYPNKKIGILPEAAESCPYPINKDASEESQAWMFHHHVAAELTLMTRYDLIVCDRTCVDIIAYTRVAKFDGLALAMQAMARMHLQHYRRIIFKHLSRNHYNCPNGHRDSEDAHFRVNVEVELISLYKTLNIKVENV